MKTHTMNISGKTHPKQIAGSIFKALKENDVVELSCIGNASNGNATKAMILARDFFLEINKDILLVPSFGREVIPGHEEPVVSLKWTITVVE